MDTKNKKWTVKRSWVYGDLLYGYMKQYFIINNSVFSMKSTTENRKLWRTVEAQAVAKWTKRTLCCNVAYQNFDRSAHHRETVRRSEVPYLAEDEPPTTVPLIKISYFDWIQKQIYFCKRYEITALVIYFHKRSKCSLLTAFCVFKWEWPNVNAPSEVKSTNTIAFITM